MDAMTRIEQALSAAINLAERPECPPQLAAAMHHAVFPRGARLRPRLCLAVAMACGDDRPDLSDAAATAIELLHCASLVHDDLPCFDDADTRRGRPSVHRAFGEPLAVLAGDALIVLAFNCLAMPLAPSARLSRLLATIAQSVGVPAGIVAGQAWECEAQVDLAHYQRAKTGALFAAATAAGALAAGHDGAGWHRFGINLGEAYQIADDIRDAVAEPDEIGKPVGRDAALARPSAVRSFGVDGSVRRLEEMVTAAIGAIPPCPGQAELTALVRLEVKRLLPKKLAQQAA